MALVLSGERPRAAEVSGNPVRAVIAWYARLRSDRARRMALNDLIGMDDHRLADLGISRQNLFEVANGVPQAKPLAARRAASSRAWLSA